MNQQAHWKGTGASKSSRRLDLVAVPILGAPADPTIDLDRVAAALVDLSAGLGSTVPANIAALELWGPWLPTEDQQAHAALGDEVGASLFREALALTVLREPGHSGALIALGGDVILGGKTLPVVAGDHPGLVGFTVSGADAVATAGAALIIEQGVEGHAGQVAPIPYDAEHAPSLFASLEGLAGALDRLARAGLSEWVRSSANRFVAVSDGSPYAGRYSVCGPELPSTVFLDARGSSIDLIESIVHEASHQQLFLIELDRPLVLQHVLTPSPFRSGLRSLRRVLAGAHAFANSIQALKLALPAEEPGLARRIAQLENKLAASLQILEGHEALSPVASGILQRIRAVHDLAPFQPRSPDFGRHGAGATSPWGWLEDRAAWFDRFHGHAELWAPVQIAPRDHARLQQVLLSAARARADWLFHPCLGSVLGAKGAQEVDLLRWAARHSPELADVRIKLDAPVLLWTESGGRRLAPGTWSAGQLLEPDVDIGLPGPFSLDTLGRFFDRDVSELVPDAGFAGDLGRLFQAIAVFETASPSALDWVLHVTRVLAVPCASPRRSLRSLSHPFVPGAIFLEMFGSTADVVELLVHESAHQMLFLAEAGGDLVDPQHTQLYWSPLRRDPRPLRGILLAYHALAYICAAQSDLRRAGALNPRSVTGLEDLFHRAELAGRVLEGGLKGLTPRGQTFFEQTREVLRYAR